MPSKHIDIIDRKADNLTRIAGVLLHVLASHLVVF